ncbi:hypothetical protein O6H91_15G087600 [Diphasiastrum complanatum]|uniref:Uncharacterized protein n=1 Tax=Diphasiastrum complanatum TaxID=34168 RepID=A0ACC2BKI8_DIPCM|nr:hypothetical protein O6H91_15G087600 [Diphasiastrum complanatum]
MAVQLIGMRYLQQQCKVYCDVATSSFDNLVEQSSTLVYKHLQMYFMIVSMDSPQYCSGKYCLAIVTEGVKAFSKSLCIVVRQWSIDVLVKVLLRGIVIVNPRLCESQRCQLLLTISRAVDYFLDHHTVDQGVLKGIIALASPDKGTFLLLSYLIDVLAGLASGEQSENIADTHLSLDLESAFVLSELKQERESDANVTEALVQQFLIQQIYVAAMTPDIRRAVLAALKNGESLTQISDSHDSKNTVYPSPVCCITLEPLLFPDGPITMDVAAVRSYVNGKEHAFLYRGHALFDWLGSRQVPKSPETRSLIKPNDIYRLS